MKLQRQLLVFLPRILSAACRVALLHIVAPKLHLNGDQSLRCFLWEVANMED